AQSPGPSEAVEIIEEPASISGVIPDREVVSQPAGGLVERLLDRRLVRVVVFALLYLGADHLPGDDECGNAGDPHTPPPPPPCPALACHHCPSSFRRCSGSTTNDRAPGASLRR